jgi:hypothetical protein
VLKDLEARESHEFVFAQRIALYHLGLGDQKGAFEWLDRAVDQHDPTLVAIGREPPYDRVGFDPRFTRLLARIGLGQ